MTRIVERKYKQVSLVYGFERVSGVFYWPKVLVRFIIHYNIYLFEYKIDRKNLFGFLLGAEENNFSTTHTVQKCERNRNIPSARPPKASTTQRASARAIKLDSARPRRDVRFEIPQRGHAPKYRPSARILPTPYRRPLYIVDTVSRKSH